MKTCQKPLPAIRPETEEFWRAAKRRELRFQQCKACGKKLFFPRLVCSHCLAADLDWVRSAGTGTVYSYTVIFQAAHEGFSAEVPYVYAIIELDEGVRLISNVVGIEPDKVEIGMKVKAVFEDATEEIAIPKFEPL